MESPTAHPVNLPKEENPEEFDWSSLLEDDLSATQETFQSFPQVNDQDDGFFSLGFDFPPAFEENGLISCHTNAAFSQGEDGSCRGRAGGGRKSIKKRTSTLEYDEIQSYFHVPIGKAAKEMKVGLTVLKRRCRELNIMRWPHRKIKSLESLIKNVREMGLTEEVAMLEQHKQLLEILPDLELTEGAKKLRQACFKANYKKRRASPDVLS